MTEEFKNKQKDLIKDEVLRALRGERGIELNEEQEIARRKRLMEKLKKVSESIREAKS